MRSTLSSVNESSLVLPQLSTAHTPIVNHGGAHCKETKRTKSLERSEQKKNKKKKKPETSIVEEMGVVEGRRKL